MFSPFWVVLIFWSVARWLCRLSVVSLVSLDFELRREWIRFCSVLLRCHTFFANTTNERTIIFRQRHVYTLYTPNQINNNSVRLFVVYRPLFLLRSCARCSTAERMQSAFLELFTILNVILFINNVFGCYFYFYFWCCISYVGRSGTHTHRDTRSQRTRGSDTVQKANIWNYDHNAIRLPFVCIFAQLFL